MTYNIETMNHREIQQLLKVLWNTSGNSLRGRGYNFRRNRKTEEMRESLRAIMATDWFKNWLVEEPKRQQRWAEEKAAIRAREEQRKASYRPLQLSTGEQP